MNFNGRCGFCGKEYLSQKSFEKHYIICRNLNTNVCKKKATTNLNSISLKLNNVLLLLSEQSKRLKKIERKSANYIRNILEHLNDNMKLPSNYNYIDFMKNKVDVSQEDYNNFMIDGYLKGYSDILYKNIINYDKGIIMGFREKVNCLYYYDNDEWKEFNIEEFNKLIMKIRMELVFISFDKEKKFEINSKKYDELVEHRKYIYHDSRSLTSKIYKNIYDSLKISINSII